ncbi:MAG: hypothetical protein ACXADC_14995 [Candidatus Thorarchaeota archaeon]
MRVLSAREFDSEAVHEFFESKSKKRGLFKREPLEDVTSFPLIWRPFRYVQWISDDEDICGMSLVDEELASSVSLNEDEQILLWRPRYANLESHECEDCQPVKSGVSVNDNSIQRITDALVKRRNDAQEALDELSPEGRGADPQAAMALVIPRTPGRLRKREKVADEIRYHHGILVGTSLVSDVPQEARVQGGIVKDRAYIGTFLAEFRNLGSDDIRIGAMETPSASTLRAAWSLGRALTRLSELNDASLKHLQKLVR